MGQTWAGWELQCPQFPSKPRAGAIAGAGSLTVVVWREIDRRVEARRVDLASMVYGGERPAQRERRGMEGGGSGGSGGGFGGSSGVMDEKEAEAHNAGADENQA